MRIFFTILLISVHLFNIGGYRLLFHFLTEKADKHIIEQLDQHSYDEEDLITMKVPLNLAYLSNNWQEFERFDGSIEIDGTHYNYVKRKVYNDTLILLCIPNIPKNKLNDAKGEFAKMAGDAQSSSEKTGLHLQEKSWLKEYSYSDPAYNLLALPVEQQVYYLKNDHTSYSSFVMIPELPPRLV